MPYDTEARAFIAPHGHLIEYLGIDVLGMWKQIPKAQRARLRHPRHGLVGR